MNTTSRNPTLVGHDDKLDLIVWDPLLHKIGFQSPGEPSASASLTVGHKELDLQMPSIGQSAQSQPWYEIKLQKDFPTDPITANDPVNCQPWTPTITREEYSRNGYEKSHNSTTQHNSEISVQFADDWRKRQEELGDITGLVTWSPLSIYIG